MEITTLKNDIFNVAKQYQELSQKYLNLCDKVKQINRNALKKEN